MTKSAAELYRIEQARQLLKSLGYIEQPDGTFIEPSNNLVADQQE